MMSRRRFSAQRWLQLYLRAPALVAIALGLFLLPRPSDAQSPSASASDAALREHGREIFTDKCGQCHDADAAKKLPDGTTLLERLSARKDPQTKLATRLKSMSEQDARGVSLYVEELIERFRAAQKTSAQK